MAQTEVILIGKTGQKGKRYWFKEDQGERFWQTFDASTAAVFLGREGSRVLVSWDDEHRRGDDGREFHNRNITEISVEETPGAPPQTATQVSIHRQVAAKCAAQVLTGAGPGMETEMMLQRWTLMFFDYFEKGYFDSDGVLSERQAAAVAREADDDIPFG